MQTVIIRGPGQRAIAHRRRKHTPEVWKALFMSACGHQVQFAQGLDGSPFPTGFRSSRLTKAQMCELMEFIVAYGNEHGVVWSGDA